MKPISMLAILLACAALLCAHALGKDANPGNNSLFEQRCNQCHPSARISNTEKTSLGWEKTVEWMQRNSAGIITRADAVKIKNYLKTITPEYPAQLFKHKCSVCHGLEKVVNCILSTEQWRDRVAMERARAVSWISLDEAEEIIAYLSRTYAQAASASNKTGRETQDQALLVQTKCLRCHSYETVFKTSYSPAEWEGINKRMRTKSPRWISDKEAGTINKYLSGKRDLP